MNHDLALSPSEGTRNMRLVGIQSLWASDSYMLPIVSLSLIFLQWGNL